MKYRVMHRAAVAEAQLELGRMGIDVDLARVDIEIQHIARMAPVVEHVPVAEPRRVAE